MFETFHHFFAFLLCQFFGFCLSNITGAKAAIEKYGSAKAWYEADADDEFSQFMGYDKVKFTINMPDGQTITERQDAGDGYGGVIDFLKRYSIYSSIIPELEAAKAAHTGRPGQ